MPGPTTLTITLTDNSTITVNIPAGLQNLNSGQTSASQTGFDSVDLMLDGIFRRKYFYDSAHATAYSVELIKSITWS
jgi:hypothetical protein